MPRVLTDSQVEEFIERGFTKVPEAFPRDAADAGRDFIWGKLAERGIRADDRSTWKNPMEFIAESYNTPPFDRCATRKLSDACSDLVGYGRWVNEGKVGWWGWWPVNFAVGADQTWDVPGDEWHFDTPDSGTCVTAPDQGLLVITLFSELGPRGGGTLVLEGSHRVVTRFFNESPGMKQSAARDACCARHPYLRELTGRTESGESVGSPLPGTDTSNTRAAHAGSLQPSIGGPATTPRIERFMNETWTDPVDGKSLRIVELTGSPGDVILGHPFLLHSPSFNHSGVPRFMCNQKTPLKEPTRLDRADGDYSPLEESLRRALNASQSPSG